MSTRHDPITAISYAVNSWWVTDEHQKRAYRDRGYPIIDLEGVKPELLQAAQELLEALEAIEEAARQVMAGEMAASSIMVERLKAQAAIAKARGESK